jgi:hypothetical protein
MSSGATWRRPQNCEGRTKQVNSGRMGKQNVVLALLPKLSGASTASVAETMCFIYKRSRLALLIGVCGAVVYIAQ